MTYAMIQINLHVHPADNPAGQDGNNKPHAEIDGCDLPPEQTVQKHHGNLVDQGSEMKKEKITPSGMPVLTKPRKRGTAEQGDTDEEIRNGQRPAI
jgi:hypothetical protein